MQLVQQVGQGDIRFNRGQDVSQLILVQGLKLGQFFLPLHVARLPLQTHGIVVAQLFLRQRRAGNHGIGIVVVDLQFFAQIVHIGLGRLDLLLFGLELILQHLDAIQGKLFALVKPVALIRFGYGIGNEGRLFFVLAVDGDFNELGVAHGVQTHAPLQQLHGFRGFERFPAIIFFAPGRVQTKGFNDLSQNHAILDDFEFGLNKIRIVLGYIRYPVKTLNVRRGIGLNLDPDRAGIGFRQKKSDRRGDDGGDQENGDDDGLANADDAPIIQKVQPAFLLRLGLQ